MAALGAQHKVVGSSHARLCCCCEGSLVSSSSVLFSSLPPSSPPLLSFLSSSPAFSPPSFLLLSSSLCPSPSSPLLAPLLLSSPLLCSPLLATLLPSPLLSSAQSSPSALSSPSGLSPSLLSCALRCYTLVLVSRPPFLSSVILCWPVFSSPLLSLPAVLCSPVVTCLICSPLLSPLHSLHSSAGLSRLLHCSALLFCLCAALLSSPLLW
jgi:hypothetical protein